MYCKYKCYSFFSAVAVSVAVAVFVFVVVVADVVVVGQAGSAITLESLSSSEIPTFLRGLTLIRLGGGANLAGRMFLNGYKPPSPNTTRTFFSPLHFFFYF